LTVRNASRIIDAEIEETLLQTKHYCLKATIHDDGYEDVVLFADNRNIKLAAQQIVDDAYAIRSNRVFERDGWKCRASGCSRGSHLQCHHVKYRSHGRKDIMQNLVTVCAAHHDDIHRGRTVVFKEGG
jgi:hypothetical protein